MSEMIELMVLVVVFALILRWAVRRWYRWRAGLAMAAALFAVAAALPQPVTDRRRKVTPPEIAAPAGDEDVPEDRREPCPSA